MNVKSELNDIPYCSVIDNLIYDCFKDAFK